MTTTITVDGGEPVTVVEDTPAPDPEPAAVVIEPEPKEDDSEVDQWPELSEIREQLSQLTTEIRISNSQALESASTIRTLLETNQRLTQQIADTSTPPPSPDPPDPTKQSQDEPPKEKEKESEPAVVIETESDLPPSPPHEPKPLRRRRSI